MWTNPQFDTSFKIKKQALAKSKTSKDLEDLSRQLKWIVTDLFPWLKEMPSHKIN